MEPDRFTNKAPGRCLKTESGYFAFHPNPLPPKLSWDGDLVAQLSRADRALATLSGEGQLLPNPDWLVGFHFRQEAVSSSRIEGTQTNVGELLLYENKELVDKVDDAREVFNHLEASREGLRMIRDDLPISTRLIKALHHTLMKEARGGEHANTPGQFRRSQNWIRGNSPQDAIFVPPPHEELDAMMGKWENYLHKNTNEPPLVKAALLHYQFEAIHPFLDGNGRIGRLLMGLFLQSENCLSQPLLYLSEFFETTREDYYRHLINVSYKGAWRDWIRYFLCGIEKQAKHSLKLTQYIINLHKDYQRKLREAKKFPKEAGRVLDHIFISPILSIAHYVRQTDANYNSAKAGFDFWVAQGLLKEMEMGKRKRNKLFIAEKLLDALPKDKAP